MIVFFTFIKLTFYLRIFDNISFLVMMVQSVFFDLKYFLLFFALVIGAFAITMGILVGQNTDTYQGISIVSYFIMSFRTSIGDYNFDDYSQNSDYKIITWIIWFSIMIIGNVIFMNFIIAVVNESYENSMLRMV